MEWLNYHHLRYFWSVARQGTIASASQELHIAQPTICGQIHELEEALGERLFQKSGRNLILTEMGRVVFRYANDIFGLGKEMMDVIKRRPTGRPIKFLVGVSDAMPKLIAYRLLEPAIQSVGSIQMICREGKADRLLADLSIHELDIVLTDEPINPSVKVKAYNHLLGESTVTIFGTFALAKKYRPSFPFSLNNTPFLFPMEGTGSRRSLDQWFELKGIRPKIAGEFQDVALLTVFGQAGIGVFAASSVIEKDILKQYGLHAIGRLDSIHERFYAISVERKIKHQAVFAISEAAKSKLFGSGLLSPLKPQSDR